HPMPESATQPRHGLRDPETINRESSRWIRAEPLEELESLTAPGMKRMDQPHTSIVNAGNERIRR
ncbi:hypothetical protein ACFWBS_55420, partial [Streptomyces mirabilis]|uniref:hypothetical protein n=1 Tax=Streptomyces mirabilis TaxID=68239 RepID=UPI00365E139D